MAKGNGDSGKLPKELRPLARRARRQGWRLVWRPSGHVHWHPPWGGPPEVCGTNGAPERFRRRIEGMLG